MEVRREREAGRRRERDQGRQVAKKGDRVAFQVKAALLCPACCHQSQTLLMFLLGHLA